MQCVNTQKIYSLLCEVNYCEKVTPCSSQYKSQYIFEGLKRTAMKHDINIEWFYGIPGHGRGLVDGMSSFGCKSILRDALMSAKL